MSNVGQEQGLKVQYIEPEKNWTETGLDWKKPDFQLQFDHSMKKKTKKTDETKPVSTGLTQFKVDRVILVNTLCLQLF